MGRVYLLLPGSLKPKYRDGWDRERNVDRNYSLCFTVQWTCMASWKLLCLILINLLWTLRIKSKTGSWFRGRSLSHDRLAGKQDVSCQLQRTEMEAKQQNVTFQSQEAIKIYRATSDGLGLKIHKRQQWLTSEPLLSSCFYSGPSTMQGSFLLALLFFFTFPFSFILNTIILSHLSTLLINSLDRIAKALNHWVPSHLVAIWLLLQTIFILKACPFSYSVTYDAFFFFAKKSIETSFFATWWFLKYLHGLIVVLLWCFTFHHSFTCLQALGKDVAMLFAKGHLQFAGPPRNGPPFSSHPGTF